MRERFRRLAVLPALLLLVSGSALAQSGKVTSIKVSGSKRFPGEQIAAMSDLKPGDEVSRDDIQAAADRLAQLGPFQSVKFRFGSKGQDVDIEFLVEDAPSVPVSFDNFPWFSDEELIAALRAEIPFFDDTAPEQGGILDLMNQTLEKKLAERGIKAVVERSLLGRPDGEGMMMQFHVAGATMRVKGIQFGDALANEDKRVRGRLEDVVGKAYSRFSVEVFLREQVRPIYWERGNLEVRFGTPEVRFTGNPNQPADAVLVVVPVEPGPAYTWAGAQWSGNAAFGPAALNGYLGLTLGQVADGNRIIAALDHVRDEYWRRGFLDFKMETVQELDSKTAKARYQLTITEGPQYRMGDMIITGLSVAAERLLRAAWRIQPGEVFDRLYFEDFVENGAKLSFGDLPVHYDQIGRWLRTNPEKKAVDVLLDFK